MHDKKAAAAVAAAASSLFLGSSAKALPPLRRTSLYLNVSFTVNDSFW